MSLTAVTEGPHPLEFLRSEAPGQRSRENITIDQSQTIKPGSVLGQKALGAATVTPGSIVSGSGGTPGNGSIGTVTADAGAMAGDYKQVFIKANTNAGTFNVFRPDGSLDGAGHVGAAYDGSINFTQADGSADFVEGDYRTINVSYAAGSGKYVGVNPSATDGSQNASAIAGYPAVTASGENAQIAAIVRAAEVQLDRLDFGSLNSGQKTAAIAQLAALGIQVRS